VHPVGCERPAIERAPRVTGAGPAARGGAPGEIAQAAGGATGVAAIEHQRDRDAPVVCIDLAGEPIEVERELDVADVTLRPRERRLPRGVGPADVDWNQRLVDAVAALERLPRCRDPTAMAGVVNIDLVSGLCALGQRCERTADVRRGRPRSLVAHRLAPMPRRCDQRRDLARPIGEPLLQHGLHAEHVVHAAAQRRVARAVRQKIREVAVRADQQHVKRGLDHHGFS
jgi:hypothetical protein